MWRRTNQQHRKQQPTLVSACCVVCLLAASASTGAHGALLLPLPAPAFGKAANAVPGDVYRWRPRALEGQLALNTRLRAAVRLFDGRVWGAESVVVGPRGQLVMLDRHNNLWEAHERNDSSSSSGTSGSSGSGSGSSGGAAAAARWQLAAQPTARLGAGRPLGYHFSTLSSDHLLVCDSLKGLVQFSYSSGQLTVLASHVSGSSPLDAGSPITYANDLAVARDGSVWFTSCTDIVPPLNALGFYDTYRAWFLSLMQGLPRGRLLRYDPATKQTHVVAKGFYYANGVALSRDGSYVVVAETDTLRLHRVWVEGPQAGQSEVLIDRLPGMPDGVDEALDGGFWVSLVAPCPPFRSALLSRFIRAPLMRALAAWLPPALRPGLRAWGAVLKVDADGVITDFLTDPDGAHVATVSAVVEQRLPHGGSRLWLGNLVGSYVSYVDLPLNARQPDAAGGGAGTRASQAAVRTADEL